MESPWNRLLRALREREFAAAGYMAGWALVAHIPAPVAYRLADLAADCASRWGRGPDQLRRNLARVVGNTQLTRGVVRDAMRSYARYWVEAFRLPSICSDPNLHRALVAGVEGAEHFYAGRDRGRGVILTLPHSGNWDMAGVALVHLNGRFTTVAEKLNPAALYEAFVDYRSSLGFEVLPHVDDAGRGPYEKLKGVLEAGGVVCLPGERDLKASGVEVELCGEPALFPAGPARLALETGASLHAVHSWFPRRGEWGLSVSPPLEVDTVEATTQRIADAFGQAISRAPADWHMLQPVWIADLDPERRQRALERQRAFERQRGTEEQPGAGASSHARSQSADQPGGGACE